MSINPRHKDNAQQSVFYEIHVEGLLDDKWGERLGGLSIDHARHGQRSITVLSGPVIDQAALFGILNALYDLHMPLVYVARQQGTDYE